MHWNGVELHIDTNLWYINRMFSYMIINGMLPWQLTLIPIKQNIPDVAMREVIIRESSMNKSHKVAIMIKCCCTNSINQSCAIEHYFPIVTSSIDFLHTSCNGAPLAQTSTWWVPPSWNITVMNFFLRKTELWRCALCQIEELTIPDSSIR